MRDTGGELAERTDDLSESLHQQTAINCKSMRSAAIRGSNSRCFVNGLSVFEPDPLAALRSVAEAKQAEPA